MRISVKSLRVSMLVGNLAVAVGLLVHYAYSMWPDALHRAAPWLFSAHTEAATVELEDPADFRPSGEVVVENKVASVAAVAVRLQPRKPAPPPVVTPRDETTESSEPPPLSEDGEPIEGGPLAEKNWIFTQALVFQGQPERSMVRLQQKPEEESDSDPRSAVTRKFGRTTRIIQARSRTTSARSRGDDDEIWIRVSRRHYVDEDRELDFWVHYVDTERFVYWMDDDPKRMYVLPRFSESPYVQRGKRERFLGEDEEEDEEEAKKDEDVGRGRIALRPEGYEDLREEDYRALIEGRKPKGVIEPTRIGGSPQKREEGTQVTPSSIRSSRSTPSSRTSSFGGSDRFKMSETKPSTKGLDTKAGGKPEKEATIEDVGRTIREIKTRSDLSPKDRKDLEALEKTILGPKKR